MNFNEIWLSLSLIDEKHFHITKMSGNSPVNGDSDGEDLRTRAASHGLVNEAVILAIRKQQQLQLERQQEQQQLLLEHQYQQQQEQLQREQQLLQQEEQMRESSDGSPPCTSVSNEIPSPPPPSSLPPPPTTTIFSAVTSLAGPVFSVIENQIIATEEVDVDHDMTDRVTDEEEVSENIYFL